MKLEMNPVAVNTKATVKEWIGLAIIALPCFVYAMDLTILNLAIPKISTDLHPTGAEMLWIIDIYGFMVSGMLITMGILGDNIGRRRLLLIGAVAFAIASTAAAFSTTAVMLIINRAILGIAGATVAPSTLSLIRNMFHDGKQRTVAIGVWAASYSIGSAAGPLIGGLILQYFSWEGIFLASVPVMMLLLILGPGFLPEFKNENRLPIDFISVVLSIASILLIVFGLKKISEDGFDLIYIASVAIGLELGRRFFARQTVIASPLIDVELLKPKSPIGSLLTMNMLIVLIAFGGYMYMSQYLQLVLKLSPLEASLWIMPWSLGFMAGSMIAPKLLASFKHSSIILAGLAMAAMAFIILSFVSTLQLAAIVATSIIFSLGIAPVVTLLTDLILSSVEPGKAGTAGALAETSSELGGSLGIAILGSIGNAVYRHNINGQSLTNIHESDNSSFYQPGNIATEAFVGAMQVVALLCAAIAIASIILVWTSILRKQRV